MEFFSSVTLIVCLVAAFDVANYHYFRLPRTIGLLVISLLCSLFFIGLGHLQPELYKQAKEALESIDFGKTLMQGMLSFLLFAGALQIEFEDLRRERRFISLAATFGVVLSTALVAVLCYLVFAAVGFDMSFLYCLLFGALISPTDPIAVSSIIKTGKLPKALQVRVSGESLFNDGLGVVVFSVLFSFVVSGQDIEVASVIEVFLREAVGGMLFGLVLGYLGYRVLKTIDDYNTEILITIALVLGGYWLSAALHTSGPLAVVVAGLLIGNTGREFAMSRETRENLDKFWELVDEFLNAILFVLIGVEVIVVDFAPSLVVVGTLAICSVLLSRFVALGVVTRFCRGQGKFGGRTVAIMTWAGLRGGLSVALALSIPRGLEREIILSLTYITVIFSITVQGLSLERVIGRLSGRASPEIA